MLAKESKEKRDIGVGLGIGILVLSALALNLIFKQSLFLSISAASILGVVIGIIFSRSGD